MPHIVLLFSRWERHFLPSPLITRSTNSMAGRTRTSGRGRGSITRYHSSERAVISFRLLTLPLARARYSCKGAGRTDGWPVALPAFFCPVPSPQSHSLAAAQPSALALWRKQLGCRCCTKRRDAVWVLIQCIDLGHLNHDLHQPAIFSK